MKVKEKKKLGIIFGILISLIILVSALSIVKNYYPDSKTIEIKTNTNIKLANITLESNTWFCNRDCQAVLKFKTFQNVSPYIQILNINISRGLRFLSDKNGSWDNITFNNYTIFIGVNENSTIIISETNNTIFWNETNLSTILKKFANNGTYYLKLEGKKEPRENLDWILNFLNFDFSEWAYWFSWQDWNDDFEDSNINETNWIRGMRTTGTGGGCSAGECNCDNGIDSCLTETGTGLNSRVDLLNQISNCDAGETCKQWISLKTEQDFNDGRNYIINFSANHSQISIAGQNPSFDIVLTSNKGNSTSADYGDLTPRFVIYSTRDPPGDNDNKEFLNKSLANYRIQKTGRNYTLYNESGTIINSTLSNLTADYLAFETQVAWSGVGGQDHNSRVFNFTVLSSDLMTVTLVSPPNNTITNQSGIFNCSADTSTGNDLLNVTFRFWNSTQVVVNSTNFSISGNLNSTTLNHSFLREDTYRWNCLFYNNNSFGSYATGNFTIIVNNTEQPIGNITQINTTLGSQNIDFAFNTTDNFPGINSCFYTITNSTGGVDASTTANISFTCGSSITETLSNFGGFNLTIYSNDSSINNNLNWTKKNFTLIAGGGVDGTKTSGGPSTSETKKLNWTIGNEQGGKDYIFVMFQGDERDRKIRFKSFESEDLTLNVFCKPVKGLRNLCPYVNITNSTIIIPPSTTSFTYDTFKLTLPLDKQLVPDGEYFFNIVAEDSNKDTKKISVQANVGITGLFSKYISKILGKQFLDLKFISSKAKILPIPNLLILVLSNVLLFGVLFLVSFKTKFRLFVAVIGSFLLSWGIILWFL